MKTVNIMTMPPSEILRKEAFKRAIPSANLTPKGIPRRIGGADTLAPSDGSDKLEFEIFSQADFLREFDVNSHAINSLKYYPNPITKDSEGKFYQKVKSRVAIGFQERIFTKRVSTLTSNNLNLRITNSKSGEKENNMLGLFREGWENKNMETAIYEAVCADGKVGDCAIAFFMSDKKIGWRSFSYDKGDVLYPHYDPYSGELALFGRRYSMTDEEGASRQYLDVWDSQRYARYVYEEKGENRSNAQWVVDQPAVPHGFPFMPVAYDRYGNPFWANSQSLIEEYENAISQLSENNMAYALRILYAFGAEMDMQSTIDGTPTTINSASTDAKVGFLEPADASNSFTLQLNTLEKNIMKCSFAVETPEIHSGSDMSSLTVKMLFADSYQKALLDSQHFQPFIDKLIAVFKWGYGLELGMSSDFEAFKVKGELFPYIFMSETEQVSNIMQLTSVKAMSKKTASELAYELGYGVVSEYQRILQEEHDELVGENKQTNTADNDVNNFRNSTQSSTLEQ